MNLAQREQRIQTVCLLILSTAAVAAALYWLRPVLVPFVFAVFIAYGLLPLTELQVRQLHLPRLIQPLKCPAQILILKKQLRLHWVCSSKMGFLLPGRVHPLFLPENTFYTQNGTSPPIDFRLTRIGRIVYR